MAQIPRILKNFTLFADGRGLAGTIDTLTLPTLTTKMEEVRAGGMDAPIEHDMGMEKLEASFSLLEFNESIIALWGLASADKQLTARGAMRRDGEDAVPIVVNMTGVVKQLEPGDWKAGDATKPKFTMALRYYKLTIAGTELIEIDKTNMIRKISGVDQLATIRQAIGV
jgi:P2 family phage contractile tail tube protein